jgi:tetratricopeptide (TPR) repeat protein
MRPSVVAISGVLLLAIAIPAWAAGQGNWDDCNQQGDIDRRINGCTAIIQDQSESEKNRALAYNIRGAAYVAKSDLDRAIADYSEAIRLDPRSAFAYNNRGRAYREKGDDDRAIADLNEAIKLDPNLTAPYYNRGRAYNNIGDLDRAMADYSQAIRLDPTFFLGYLGRGRVYSERGELDRAITDFAEVVRLAPRLSYGYFSRGLAYFQRGSLAESLADFDQAIELAPSGAYQALWRDIAARRSNLPSRLHQGTSQIDMTAWPAPVIHLFLGKMSPAAVLAAADDPDPKKKKRQMCHANFYGGELALIEGSKENAVRQLRFAARDCLQGSSEREAANAELRSLGLRP